MNQFVGVGGIDTAEHSAKSGSKKTILGPLTLAANPANEDQSIATITASAGSPLTLLRGKTYRVIGTADWHMRMYNTGTIAPTVTTSDVLIPAKTPVTIKADIWDVIGTAGSGTIIAVELA